ncbi:hypothetical protein JRO89_XS01G0343200 [Xanthoceras sorbifolium]|uniref:O-methyltransferase C-terminal domain-containing protein n=1 Tax=Xanthoceras sorbifolium TaxID=99658 RepID=A0ABQ8IN47_9ROSI|nr:hypothetical protein JRO89_XS01G0343200 [Xanthoceras sorbifolium]
MIRMRKMNLLLVCRPKLKDAIIEGGIPFNMVHGMHIFEYAAANPRFNEVYNKALFNHTTYLCDEEDSRIVQGFRAVRATFGRVKHLSGDMFQTVPKGDAVILKSVLNCWDDENCLRSTSEAARDISLLHVRLLIRDDGATERTKEEFMALASGSGFKGINSV